MQRKSAIHLNGNIVCAVDVETTGTDPEKHDIVQICVLPLDSEYAPYKGILPFYTEMKPVRIENVEDDALKANKLRLADLQVRGIEPMACADLFESWFNKIGLPLGKRISPLAHNWPFDRGFLIQWLGLASFEYIFDGRFRDTMVAALFSNDRADSNVEQIPYPKVNLPYISKVLGVENDRKHDAMADCIATAESYRLMLKSLF